MVVNGRAALRKAWTCEFVLLEVH